MSEAVDQQGFIYVPRKIIVISLIVHVALPMLYFGVVGLEKLGIKLFPSSKPIEVYQNFIQVDMVALPDELMNQKFDVDPTLPIVEKASSASEPTTAQEEADAMRLAEEKAAVEKAKSEKEKKTAEAAEKKARVDKEKALKAMEREAEKANALKGLKEKAGEKGRQKISGNLLSKGTAMSGKVGTAKDRYSALVAMKIRENFNIFPWQKKKGLATSVYIEITAQGRVKEKKLMKQSRDPVFDAAVLQAIEASQPLPVPEDMSLVSDGIQLEFRPEN